MHTKRKKGSSQREREGIQGEERWVVVMMEHNDCKENNSEL